MIFRAAHSGGHLRLHAKFDADAVLRELVTERVTHLSLVATTLQRVLDARGDGPIAHELHALLIGGGPLPGPLRARAVAAGLAPLHTYGLTETASQVVTVRPGDVAQAGDSVGTPLPGVALRIVDDARTPVPAGTAGEIELRGPSVMLGYEHDAEATAEALADGWLRTRDLGTLDARGFLTVHARRSDLIKSGGENIYPAEVEAALLGAPGVRDAAVLGEPDPTWGQVAVAAVVLEPGAALESLQPHLQAVLARFKHPRRWVRVEALPRTASGKVDRLALRALLG
jgi:O-succinylbenzoic acid--CoA ligase